MIKSLLALLAVFALVSPVSADNYINTQLFVGNQLAVNFSAAYNIDDVEQTAVNVANTYEAKDTDVYNDNYRSHQRVYADQIAINVALAGHGDDVIQTAFNLANEVIIDDKDGNYFLGSQSVHVGQSVSNDQIAGNVSVAHGIDDVEQVAANDINLADIKMSNPNLNGINVYTHQFSSSLQVAGNVAIASHGGTVTQTAQNRANVVVIKH